MSKQILLPAFVVMAASAFAGGGVTTSDYVQSGLIAQWDAIDNTGRGYHDANQTYWWDLKGKRPLVTTKRKVTSYVEWKDGNRALFKAWGEDGGILSEADSAAVFGDGTSDTVRTVEIIYDCNGQGTGILLSGNTASGIALGRWNNNNFYVANNKTGNAPTLPASPTSGFFSHAVTYVGGSMTVGYTNGAPANATSSSGYWDSSDGQARIAYRKNISNSYSGYIYAIRVYNRALTAVEVAQNYETDLNRFINNLRVGFTVVSGSVTVGGTTYGAGERLLIGPGETAVTIDTATDAVIDPGQDGLVLTLTAGTLSFSPNGDGSLLRLAGLTMGANTVVNIPSGGLTVAGTLTADETASINGPGLLVGATETAPVTLTGDATYRWARETFGGLAPSMDTLYVPVGTEVTVETSDAAANLAHLSSIVFLDDGTDDANTTKIRYTCADPLALKASVQGPGIFEAADSGKVVILGNSAGLTGNFAFSNVVTVVSNEYGLGSARSRDTQFNVGYTGTLDFGCERSVFTNYAPITMRALNTGTYKMTTIGSQSLDETLVQAAPLTVTKSVVDGNSHSCVYKNNVEFLGRLSFSNLNTYAYCWVSGTSGGRVRYSCSVANYNTSILFHSNPLNLYLNTPTLGTTQIPLYNPGIRLTVENPGAFGCADFRIQTQNTVDLNGIDTAIGNLQQYGGNVSVGSAAIGYVTSETPAQLEFVQQRVIQTNVEFQRAAGLTVAGDTGKTAVTLVTSESTTTGKLAVEIGTLTLAESYCWHGTNVVVAGGELILSSNRALPDGKAVLRVTGGKLTVKSGASVILGDAYFGSGASVVKLAPATYTIAQLQAMEGVSGYIGSDSDAAATITVEDSTPDPTEWHGWPEEGGTVAVPKKMTVYIGDDDVERVAKVTTLDLHTKATVVCTNTIPLQLTANILGSGKFTAENASLVLLGDNSGLVNPGCFQFTQSDVIVSNRYGLGGATTAPCYVYSVGASPVPKLHFGGPATTNDVEVFVDNALSFGYQTDEITFVQNANFTKTTTTGYLWTTNDCGFSKKLACSFVQNPGTLRLLEGSEFASYGDSTLYMYGQGAFHFACATGKCNLYCIIFDSNSKIYFESDAFVSTKVTVGPQPVEIHFNGHSPTFGSYSCRNYDPSTPEKPLYLDVWESDKPMTVHLSAYRYQGSGEYSRYFRLEGPISLDYNGDLNNAGGMKSGYAGFSTTSRESTITMRSGTLRFFDRSTFGGSTMTILKGTLKIADNAGDKLSEGVYGPFFKRWVNLVFADSAPATPGKLTLATGRAETVRTFCHNGAYLSAGVYGGEDAFAAGLVDSDHKLSCLGDAGDGAGTLRVLRSSPNMGFMIRVR